MPRTIVPIRHTVYNFGKSLRFNSGAGNYVTLKTSAILAGQTNATIVFWMKSIQIPPNGSTIPAMYCERPASGNDILKVEFGTTGRLRVTYRDDAGTLNQPTNASGVKINDGKWHMIAIVKSGTSITFYVDGVVDHTATLTATDTLTNANVNVRLGSDITDGNAFYNGRLDEVRLYTRPLDAAEVADLFYKKTTQNASTNNVGYYKADEGSGTSLTDSSGTQSSGTINGASYDSDVVMAGRSIAPARTVIT